MQGFVDLLKRFHSDERGVFAVLFAVMAIVLVATAGAVVDFTSVEQARTRAQQALDSAALGLQPTIYNTPTPTVESLKTKALALVNERLNDAGIATVMGNPTISLTEGTLQLQVSITVKTAFVALIGIPTITAKVVAEATRKQLNLEVAMVLDNSGSMGSYSRMTNLKKAALCAMNVLFNSITDCLDATVNASNDLAPTATTVKLGIVPFTSFVNVGIGYKTATWMDTSGLSTIANDNFDNNDYDGDAYTAAVNRFTLYNQLNNVSWSGCVEARKSPYDTNDTTPNTALPDTLFDPVFAPDEPDSGYGNSYLNDRPNACSNKDLGTWTESKRKTNCSSTWSNWDNDYSKESTFNSCGSSASTTRAQTNMTGSNVTASSTKPASMTDSLGRARTATCSTNFDSNKTNNSPKRYTLTMETSCSYQFNDRVLQERLCKYTGNISTGGGRDGPNGDCPTNAMQPLTATKSLIKTAINAMSPQGYTNIHQGAIWGFHMLSPTAPLTEAGPYQVSTSKVMIVMTDGENTVDGYNSGNMNKASGYMAYGYPGSPSQGYNGRIFDATYPNPSSDGQVTAAMDSRTVASCNSAKAAGIVVYTVGLNAPNQKTIDMLNSCATDTEHAYFPSSSNELTSVFQDIAEQLANLRLAK